jgi:hypothetical protein
VSAARLKRNGWKRLRHGHATARFFAKVRAADDGSGCLLWTGTTSTTGYGQFYAEGRNWPAHRWILERAYGPISEELVIDHLCRRRNCVRPSHLEIVTMSENILRGEAHIRFREMQARKTHCIHGHPFTPENTYMHQGKYRKCKECQRGVSRRQRAKRRAERVQTLSGT